MVGKSTAPIPRSGAQLLEILQVPQDAEPKTVKTSLLAWAARQPDAVETMPAEWITEFQELGNWPGNNAMLEAIRVGRVIRDFGGFVPMPGSRWDK